MRGDDGSTLNESGFARVTNPFRHIAAVFGLTGFVVAAVAGLVVGNPAETVLMRAIVSMFACYLCGIPLAMASVWAVEQYITSFKSKRSSPISGDAMTAGNASPRGQNEAEDEPVMIV